MSKLPSISAVLFLAFSTTTAFAQEPDKVRPTTGERSMPVIIHQPVVRPAMLPRPIDLMRNDMPPLSVILSVSGLTDKQKDQITAIYKSMREKLHPSRQQIKAQADAAKSYNDRADALAAAAQKAQGKDATPAAMTERRRNYDSAKATEHAYYVQARRISERNRQYRQQVYSKIRTLLTAQQRKELDQKAQPFPPPRPSQLQAHPVQPTKPTEPQSAQTQQQK